MEWLVGFFGVVVKNAQVYSNWGYLLLIISLALYFCVEGVKVLRKGIKAAIVRISAENCYFFVACYPFVWYFVMQNHSEQHWQFTCRILSITVFAGITGIIRIIQKDK